MFSQSQKRLALNRLALETDMIALSTKLNQIIVYYPTPSHLTQQPQHYHFCRNLPPCEQVTVMDMSTLWPSVR